VGRGGEASAKILPGIREGGGRQFFLDFTGKNKFRRGGTGMREKKKRGVQTFTEERNFAMRVKITVTKRPKGKAIYAKKKKAERELLGGPS